MNSRILQHMSPRDDADVPTMTQQPTNRPLLLAGWMVSFLLASAATVTAQAGAFPGQDWNALRTDMVERQIKSRGIKEPSILTAMERVPRHLFVPENEQDKAYRDGPVEIAPGQTLPQAYISAQMIGLLELDGNEKVLEIGTGSGYEAAILSRMAQEVYTIEINHELATTARRTLRQLGYKNVEVKIGDGFRGWPEEAPFDAILLTAAPQKIPEPLFEQLKMGGKMVVAVGGFVQNLKVITKTPDGNKERLVAAVVLEPMTGEVTQER